MSLFFDHLRRIFYRVNEHYRENEPIPHKHSRIILRAPGMQYSAVWVAFKNTGDRVAVNFQDNHDGLAKNRDS